MRESGDLTAQLNIARASNFNKVELIERQLERAETAILLERRDLQASSAHVSFESLAERPGTLVAAARNLGIGLLIVPAPPERYRNADADWREFAADLAAVAQDVRNEGARIGYHNHHWELAETGPGETALDLILAAGTHQGLEWQGDLAWIIRGGGDPFSYIDRWGDRLTSIHVKDIAVAGTVDQEDGWADVGYGTVDWPVLWRAAYDAGVRLMVAEHDAPSDGARFCSRSNHTMQRLAAQLLD